VKLVTQISALNFFGSSKKTTVLYSNLHSTGGCIPYVRIHRGVHTVCTHMHSYSNLHTTGMRLIVTVTVTLTLTLTLTVTLTVTTDTDTDSDTVTVSVPGYYHCH
jgi:hypothetical protein